MTLADLGLDWAVGKTKKDFVGKRSLARPDMLVANRKQLVGFLTDNPAIVLEEGRADHGKRQPSDRIFRAGPRDVVLSQRKLQAVRSRSPSSPPDGRAWAPSSTRRCPAALSA